MWLTCGFYEAPTHGKVIHPSILEDACKFDKYTSTRLNQGLMILKYCLFALVLLGWVMTFFGIAFLQSMPLQSVFISMGPSASLGVYLGWYYLRFLHSTPDEPLGDISEDFRLSVLFPQQMA